MPKNLRPTLAIESSGVTLLQKLVWFESIANLGVKGGLNPSDL